MAAARRELRSIDQYIAGCAPEIRATLEKLRATIRRAAPGATEVISYRMPGMFPPVRGDAKLQAAVSKYAGPKGNLKFPFAAPIPYALVARIVKFRVKQDLAKTH